MTADQRDVNFGKYLHALLTRKDWVVRRVETIELLDLDGVRRKVSLDLNLDVLRDIKNKSGIGSDGKIMIPLGLAAKSLYFSFDVQDAGGNALSLLTSDENSEIAKLVLLHVLRHAEPNRSTIPDLLINQMAEVARSSPNDDDMDLLLRPNDNGNGNAPRYVEAWKLPFANEKLENEWISYFDVPEFKQLISTFTLNFLPIVNIEVSANLSRSIIKYEYFESDSIREADLYRNVLLPVRPHRKEWWVSVGEVLAHGWSVLPERLGWRETPAILGVDGLGMASKDHLHVMAPDGVFFTDVDLYDVALEEMAASPLAPSVDPQISPAPSWGSYAYRIAPNAATVYVRNFERRRWAIGVYFRPHLDGFILPSIVTVLGSSVVLLLGSLMELFGGRLSQLMYKEVDEFVELSASATAAIALLLLVPTLFSAFLVRAGEHQVRAESLFWPRSLVAFSGVSTATAIMTLILTASGKALWITWLSLGFVLLLASACLMYSRHKEKTARMDVVVKSKGTRGGHVFE